MLFYEVAGNCEAGGGVKGWEVGIGGGIRCKSKAVQGRPQGPHSLSHQSNCPLNQPSEIPPSHMQQIPRHRLTANMASAHA